MAQSLLQLSLAAIARGLHDRASRDGLLVDLQSVPEPELGRVVWERFLEGLPLQAHPASAYQGALRVALAFAAAFWQPASLHLRRPPDEDFALDHLVHVGRRLRHLELCAPQLTQPLIALAACPQLRCLSLRGCSALPDASLEALAACTSLQALDLGGLAQLGDVAAFHVARGLPSLRHLNISHTAMSDAALEFLTYGHRLRAWARGAGVDAGALPAEAAAWPALPLAVLRAAGTRLTPAGLLLLRDLPLGQLAMLDVRQTGVPRAVLQPLQQRFGLQLVQGAVLASSNALAAAVCNHDAVACACPSPQAESQGSAAKEDGWAVEGALLLLHACPSRGTAGFLEGPVGPPTPAAGTGAQELGGPKRAQAAAGESPQLLRRRGYRAPRGRGGGLQGKRAREGEAGQEGRGPLGRQQQQQLQQAAVGREAGAQRQPGAPSPAAPPGQVQQPLPGQQSWPTPGSAAQRQALGRQPQWGWPLAYGPDPGPPPAH